MKRIVNHIAVHNIKDATTSELGKFATHGTSKFDPKDYSKFKFGDKTATEKYGMELYTTLANFLADSNIKSTPLVLTSSAYLNMPVAATFLEREVSKHLKSNKHVKFTTAKINRKTATSKDFSSMNTEERTKQTSETEIELDTTKFSQNTHLVIVDDCKITGSHSKNVLDLLTKMNDTKINRVTFIYLAELDSKSTASAKVESSINSVEVNSIATWSKVAGSSPYPMTPRALKFFLKWANDDKVAESEVKIYYNGLSNEKKKQILIGSKGIKYGGDGYRDMKEFSKAFTKLNVASVTTKLSKRRNRVAAFEKIVNKSFVFF